MEIIPENFILLLLTLAPFSQGLEMGFPSPLLCPSETKLGVLCPVQGRKRTTRESPMGAMDIVKGLDHPSDEEGLRDLSQLSL